VLIVAPLAGFGLVLLGAPAECDWDRHELGLPPRSCCSNSPPNQVRGPPSSPATLRRVTLANAIGSGAAGWLLDRSGLGVSWPAGGHGCADNLYGRFVVGVDYPGRAGAGRSGASDCRHPRLTALFRRGIRRRKI